MADDYALTHKMSSKSGKKFRKGTMVQVIEKIYPKIWMIEKPLKPISCGHCEKPGHIITNCWKLCGKTYIEHSGKFNHKS